MRLIHGAIATSEVGRSSDADSLVILPHPNHDKRDVSQLHGFTPSALWLNRIVISRIGSECLGFVISNPKYVCWMSANTFRALLAGFVGRDHRGGVARKGQRLFALFRGSTLRRMPAAPLYYPKNVLHSSNRALEYGAHRLSNCDTE